MEDEVVRQCPPQKTKQKQSPEGGVHLFSGVQGLHQVAFDNFQCGDHTGMRMSVWPCVSSKLVGVALRLLQPSSISCERLAATLGDSHPVVVIHLSKAFETAWERGPYSKPIRMCSSFAERTVAVMISLNVD